MRNSREKWTFFQHPSKQAISAADVVYWKNTLRKVLKIGVEFEFNLPDSKGTCKGDSKTCPCVHMLENNCWKACQNYDSCKTNPGVDRCSLRKKSCKPDKCAECEDYTLDCHGIYCPNFSSACFGCDKFEMNCEVCKDRYDPEKNPSNIRNRITSDLNPSNNYGIVTKAGVHSITKDGSLLGDRGVEIITVGRRVDYWEFYRMSQQILESALNKGAYMNERCSTHMHLLASYYGKLAPKESGIPSQISELERDMPEVVLANFHQLCRRYQNAITWMTMALDEPERMTRWEKFRVSVLDISAVTNSMSVVRDKVSSQAGGNKYGWVNYNNCMINEETGAVKRFHVEMRAADGILSPSAAAALACLYYSLIIKAVEISRYGVLEVGDSDWMTQAREVKEVMMNNMKDYNADDRFSNTKSLHHYFDLLKTESYEMIRQVKHILIQVGPSYQILEKLAERPITLRRIEGEKWEDIEKDLVVTMSEETEFEMKLSEFIDLRLVDECNDMKEWVESVSKAMEDDPDMKQEDKKGIGERVEKYIEDKRAEGEIIWSDSLGSVVML